MIRSAVPADAEAICHIYNYYVLNTHHNFEEEAVPAGEMAERIKTVLEKHHWLVYESGDKIAGYAYAGAWKSRCSYRYSVETTVYVAKGYSGKGIGSKLYEALLAKLDGTEIHAVIGGIALPNEGSIALHEKFGFEKIAQFMEVGYKFGRWIDVGYWEKLINSPVPGSA
jgi:phosphinothricin acetyltransferase